MNGDRKKALIVATVGGFVPQFEMDRVKLLQEMGYEVHYASNFNNPVYGTNLSVLTDAGIVLHQIDFVRSPYQMFKNIRTCQKLINVIQVEKFSIIHCHTPMGGVLSRLAVWKLRQSNAIKTILIYTVHGFHFYDGAPFINWLLYYPVEYFLAKQTDYLITINREDYKRAQNFHLGANGKIRYIPGVGIDVQALKEVAVDKAEKRRELGVHSEILIVYAGELNKGKNVKTVIKVFAAVAENCCELVVCGSGPERKSLQRLAKRLGVRQRIHFTGYREDLPQIMQISDIFLFPSYREGLSAAVMEAMASGLPVVASKIRGNKELIIEGKGGFLVNPDDVEALAGKVKILLSDQKLRKKMGDYNCKRIMQFGKEKVNKLMSGIYHDCERRKKENNK